MAGSYYDQAKTKRILEIAVADTSDDTFLDEMGSLANQHLDNILKIHDEKIPLQGTNVLNDIITAANFYTAYLYKSKRGDFESAKFFKEVFDVIIKGFTDEKAVEGVPYIIERFNSRFITGQQDEFALFGR